MNWNFCLLLILIKQGHRRLVEAISNIYSLYFDRKIDPIKEILITGGAYPSLFNAINGFLNPGDEVNINSSLFFKFQISLGYFNRTIFWLLWTNGSCSWWYCPMSTTSTSISISNSFHPTFSHLYRNLNHLTKIFPQVLIGYLIKMN